MSIPGITSDYTHHASGAGSHALETVPGMLVALTACSANTSSVDTIVLHDSLDPSTDPRPLLTLYLDATHPIEICRPMTEGYYFSIGLTAVITGSACALHVTTHDEVTL